MDVQTKKHREAHPWHATEDDMLAKRRELFGSIDRFIVSVYGERCPDVQGGCSCCAAWAARDALNATIIE